MSSAKESTVPAPRPIRTRSTAKSPSKTRCSTTRFSSSATGCRPTISPTSSTTIPWESPTWCAAANTCRARPNTICSTRRSAGRFRNTSTCRSSWGATRKGTSRSCRNATAQSASKGWSPKVTCPPRSSTTSRCSVGRRRTTARSFRLTK